MEKQTIEEALETFLHEWNSPEPTLEVQTSGSTGMPKRMRVQKERMRNSARLTCDFLRLAPGDTALLCMPLRYIAGKMMAIRAWERGLRLIVREPSGHPLADVAEPVNFAAMIPLQVYNTLRVTEERRRLERVGTLIIGGGAIDAALERELYKMPGKIYSTYGMTETLSHIALRRLNGPQASDCYTPLPQVQVSLSSADCLVIDAPLVADGRLVTNDIARIYPNGTFRILGRKDNVIASGGIKLQTEEIEATLREMMQLPFAITAVADAKFGEAVVLLASMEEKSIPQAVQALPKYQRPKHILLVEKIPMTETGKIDRAACRRLAKERLSIS